MNRAAGAQQNFNCIATLYNDRYYENRENINARTLMEFNTNNEKYGLWQGFTFTMNLGVDYVQGGYTFFITTHYLEMLQEPVV